MQYIIRGESIFIPFKEQKSIQDSQCRPRIYKNEKNFRKSFPFHSKDWDELVEYSEVKHGRYDSLHLCSECGSAMPTDNNYDFIADNEVKFCYFCGAKMEKE